MKFLAHRNVPSTQSTRSAYYYERRPEKVSGWTNFKRYIWDPEEKTICHRSGLSWCYCIVLYMGFLIILFGLFFGTMLGMVHMIRSSGKPWIDHTNSTDPRVFV